jgi:hypothetical protein
LDYKNFKSLTISRTGKDINPQRTVFFIVVGEKWSSFNKLNDPILCCAGILHLGKQQEKFTPVQETCTRMFIAKLTVGKHAGAHNTEE